MARIEVREFGIGVNEHNFAVHQFLVKYNDQGQRQELHGVAINQDTRNYNAFAAGIGNLLKVAAHPPVLGNPTLTINQFNGLYAEDQSAKTLFEGTEEEVSVRWDAAINAAGAINARTDLKYTLSGGLTEDFSTGNSNTVTATLERIMGFTPCKVSGEAAPGLNKNILSPQVSSVYEDLYNPEWGKGGDYSADDVDGLVTLGANLLNAAVTLMAEPNHLGDCTQS